MFPLSYHLTKLLISYLQVRLCSPSSLIWLTWCVHSYWSRFLYGTYCHGIQSLRRFFLLQTEGKAFFSLFFQCDRMWLWIVWDILNIIILFLATYLGLISSTGKGCFILSICTCVSLADHNFFPPFSYFIFKKWKSLKTRTLSLHFMGNWDANDLHHVMHQVVNSLERAHNLTGLDGHQSGML